MVLPMNILRKYSGSLNQLFLLFFGCGGMINQPDVDQSDDYLQARIEWLHLKRKHGLMELEPSIWKLKGSRPHNFPGMRMAQLATFYYRNHELFNTLITAESMDSINKLFEYEMSDFQIFENKSYVNNGHGIRSWSAQSRALITINAIIPLLFSYGIQSGANELQKRAISWLRQLPAEKNSVISSWAELGIKASDSFESQALLFQKTSRCDHRKCDSCIIGQHIISGKTE
jgi:hypothetical protein